MLNQKVISLMKEKDMDLKGLSATSGVSYSYLADLRRGVKKNPSATILNKIAKALDVSITDLIDD